jgi:hypothetical protein
MLLVVRNKKAFGKNERGRGRKKVGVGERSLIYVAVAERYKIQRYHNKRAQSELWAIPNDIIEVTRPVVS